MNAVRGGFDNNSGNNQSAQKQQQERISQNTLPVNCVIVNQIKRGAFGESSTNHYEWNGQAFENAIITAKFEFTSNDFTQPKIFGRLSDNTGYFSVVAQRAKDSDRLPQFLENYVEDLRNNENKTRYVRAMIKLKKSGPIQLLYFSIVHDANEISRHGLDIALRFMQRVYGHEEFMALTDKNAQPQQKTFTINKNLAPDQQVREYFEQQTKLNVHSSITKTQILEFFKDQYNGAQINQYLQRLIQNGDIFKQDNTENYFLDSK